MHFKNKVKNKTETVKQRAQEDNFKTLSIPSKIIPRERDNCSTGFGLNPKQFSRKTRDKTMEVAPVNGNHGIQMWMY